MLFRSKFVAVCLAFVTSVISVTITKDTVQISPVDLQIGDLTINPDVYYSIVNNLATVIAGSLNNQGGFYVTSTNLAAAAVSLVSGSIENSGELAFNALGANAASLYALASIAEFSNTGDMWFGTICCHLCFWLDKRWFDVFQTTIWSCVTRRVSTSSWVQWTLVS